MPERGCRGSSEEVCPEEVLQCFAGSTVAQVTQKMNKQILPGGGCCLGGFPAGDLLEVCWKLSGGFPAGGLLEVAQRRLCNGLLEATLRIP